jgi:dTDP-4-amino-4,6-dideoxygalactose transaminase
LSELAILGGKPLRTKPFAPWPQYLASDLARVQQVVESRHWGGYPMPSKYGKEFAERFAAMHGAKYGLCVANGTIAIIAALQAAGVGFGDEVIVPAYTWDGTATAVLFCGGVPVFADVDPDTYCLSVKSAHAAVTPRTKAILPVHLAMRFTDMDRLMHLANDLDLKVIEDCAHAHGGEYSGHRAKGGAGSMGDLGCFSLQESKLMTSGEGGIVITSDLKMFEHVQSQVNCGRASSTDEFQQRVLGSNYRMTDLQAALLIGQLDMWPELQAKRDAAAKRLSKALATIDGVHPLPEQAEISRSAIYHYVFKYTPAKLENVPRVARDLFVAAIEAEGVPCDGRFYEPVYRSDLFYATPENCPQLKSDYAGVHCPISERAAYDESVWLPQFLLIGDENDIDDVAAAVSKVARNLGDLAKADPALAGLKSMSRAERPKHQRPQNY